MRKLLFVITCCLSFIILGCSDFKSKSEKLEPGQDQNQSGDQESLDPSKGKDTDPNIAQEDENKRIQMITDKIQNMSDSEKLKYIQPKTLKACMYYTGNPNLVKATLDPREKISTKHHRCYNTEFKVSFNGIEHSNHLNFNNHEKYQRTVSGVKSGKVYDIPALTDKDILDKNKSDKTLVYRDDYLHTIIDVPGTVFEDLSWNENHKLNIVFEDGKCNSNGCSHKDVYTVQTSLIGSVDVVVEGVKVPYFVRKRNISMKPTSGVDNSINIDLTKMDITLHQPEFDDWCNPYVGEEDPWYKADQELAHETKMKEQIHQMSNDEKIKNISSIDSTSVCMAYVHDESQDHYCNKDIYHVLFNDEKFSTDLNLNNQNPPRTVTGISNTEYSVPAYKISSSDVTNRNHYKLFREDEWLHKIVDVPGQVFRTNPKKGLNWNEDKKLVVKLECADTKCNHNSTTAKIVKQSLIGQVTLTLDGVSIPYYIRTEPKYIGGKTVSTYDLTKMELFEKSASFDDWCGIVPADQKDAINQENEVKKKENQKAQELFKANQELLKEAKEAIKNMSNEEKLAHITNKKEAKVCMGYTYHRGTQTVSHVCNKTKYNVFFNNVQHNTILNINNGSSDNNERPSPVIGISGKVYDVPGAKTAGSSYYLSMREDGVHTAADVPGTLFDGLNWTDDGKLKVSFTCATPSGSCSHGSAKPIIFSLIGQVDLEYNGVTVPYYVTTNGIDQLSSAGKTFEIKDLQVVDGTPEFTDWCDIQNP